MDKRRDSHPRTGSATGGASPSDERAPTAPAAGAAAGAYKQNTAHETHPANAVGGWWG